MKKVAILAVAALVGASTISLSSPVPVGASKATVQAKNYKYGRVNTVKVTHNVLLQKIRKNGQKRIGKKILKRGSVVKIKRTKNGWLFVGKIPKIGKANTKAYYWIYPKNTYSWFTTSSYVSKPKQSKVSQSTSDLNEQNTNNDKRLDRSDSNVSTPQPNNNVLPDSVRQNIQSNQLSLIQKYRLIESLPASQQQEAKQALAESLGAVVPVIGGGSWSPFA